MAHRLRALYGVYYLDGLDGKPYRGRMKQAPVFINAIEGIKEIDVPVNEDAHHAWEMGRHFHRATDKHGKYFQTILVKGVVGCCRFNED